jgi:hypothetical protein
LPQLSGGLGSISAAKVLQIPHHLGRVRKRDAGALEFGYKLFWREHGPVLRHPDDDIGVGPACRLDALDVSGIECAVGVHDQDAGAAPWLWL